MGIFDQMFGTAAAAIDKASEVRFNELRQKYQSALDALDQQGGRVQSLHIEDNKLRIVGVVPSEEAKNKVWDQIKLADASYGDLSADITVDESLGQGAMETYTVKAGDSLWRIAQNKLGNGNRYMEIFYANRDKMESPQSVIHPGDELKIPQA